jgi:formyl-CoA transferase
MLQDTELSNGTRAPITGPAAKFSRTPTRVRAGAPRAGQHTEEVLGEVGLSAEELEALQAAGAIRRAAQRSAATAATAAS